MNDWIVAKFGGSSVKNAEAMLRCGKIVQDNPDIRVVIISATYNTTNMLEELAKRAAKGDREGAREVLERIRIQHWKIAEEIDANDQTMIQMEELMGEGEALLEGMYLLRESSKRAMDRLYSIGERISSALFAGVLNDLFHGEREVIYFDARKIIRTNSDFGRALPDVEAIRRECDNLLIPILHHEDSVVVTQGFIGSNEEGATTTLGREGSDFSASLIGEAIDASMVQIWTDVPGVATCDPRRVGKCAIIPDMTYEEASIMAHLGAKVLFPKTMHPLMRENIPLFVGSSLEPEKGGTWIQREASYLPLLRGLAIMDQQMLIRVTSSDLLPINHFFRRTIEALHDLKINYHFLNYSGDAVSFLTKEDDLLQELLDKELKDIALIKSERELSLLSLIGNEMDRATDVFTQIFNSLSRRAIRIMQLGSSAHSWSFLVSTHETELVAKELHQHLLNYAREKHYTLRAN